MAVYNEPVYEEPKLSGSIGKYERVLIPLQENPETWGKIGEYKNSNSAYQAALNLRHGRYKIPGEPSEWVFVAEDNEVFAMYTKEKS